MSRKPSSKVICEYKGDAAPKVKRGPTFKVIQEGQPEPVRLQYAMSVGISPAIGENPSTYDKPKKTRR